MPQYIIIIIVGVVAIFDVREMFKIVKIKNLQGLWLAFVVPESIWDYPNATR